MREGESEGFRPITLQSRMSPRETSGEKENKVHEYHKLLKVASAPRR